MTCKESIKWLENLKSDLGKSQFSELWHYEQALAETIELLQSDRLVEIPCKVGDKVYCDGKYFADHCAGKVMEFVIYDVRTNAYTYIVVNLIYVLGFQILEKSYSLLVKKQKQN